MGQLKETSSALSSFIRAPNAEMNATHRFGEIQIIPSAVVRCFGEGESGDGFKVFRTWIFRRGDLVFTLYDWKSTSLFDAEMWTPQELWASHEPFDLHIGSKEPATANDVDEFIAYLLQATSV